jgi:hypothetical protein
LAAGIPRQSDGGNSIGVAAPGDHYLRIAVAMELLRLHIVEGQRRDEEGGGSGGGGGGGGKLRKKKSSSNAFISRPDDNDDSENNSRKPHGDEAVHSLEALGEMCMEGLGVNDVEGIILKELENAEAMANGGGGGGGDDANTFKLEDQVAEKLNRFLEEYVNSVNKVKAKLLHQVSCLKIK